MIPKQLQNSSFRFILIRKGTKRPFEDKWQDTANYSFDNKKLQGHIKQNINYGVLGGYGNLVIIDCDLLQAELAVVKHLPKTFKVRTGRGGAHFYFICKNLDKPIRLKDTHAGDIGDVQGKGKQVIGPGSLHENGKTYVVEDDLPIAEITSEEIKFALKDFLIIKEKAEAPINKDHENIELQITSVAPLSQMTKQGDEYFGEHPVHGSSNKMNFWVNPIKNTWHCFRHDTGGGPISLIAILEGVIDCGDATSGGLRGDKFLETVKIAQKKHGLKLPENKTLDYETLMATDELLELKTANDIFNLKPNKEYIVDQFIYPQNIIMLVSPPKNYKSLFSLYLSMCISNGRSFFGLKTKKSNVLYLDKENNDSLIHQRLHAIRRGHPKLFPKKNFPLQFLIRQGDINNVEWVEKLKNTVKKHEIRLIVFDTLHRFGDYDENSANDINNLYNNVFNPLISDQNCSILLLHHTKKDGGYRGSGDLLGFVDSAYQVRKTNIDGFKIDCIAARGGEIDEIVGTVDVEQDDHKQLYSVNFIQKSHEEIVGKASEQWTKKKQACDLIMGYFKSKGLDSYRKKDIEYAILLEKKDELSKETIKSAFKYLVFKRILLSDGKGLYTKIDDWFSIAD